jgi:NADH dehydrogenase FAD-containing subunit
VRRVAAALTALREAADSPSGAPRAVVSIVGAGYAGVELAAMAADLLRSTGASVQLLSPSGSLMPVRPVHL